MSAYDNPCPECDGPMKSRTNKTTGQKFWGCAAYPKCKGTRNTDGESPSSYRREARDDMRRDSESPTERARTNDRARWRHQG